MKYPNGRTQVDARVSDNKKIIEQGIDAARQQNWWLVIHHLQQLRLDRKRRSLILLSETHWNQGFQLALSVLFHGDFQQRWEIAKIIPQLGEKVIDPLIAICDDEEVDEEIRWFICHILGAFSHPAIVIALVKLIQHTEQEELALVAAQTLAQIGKSAVDALSKLLAAEEYRLLSVQALAHIRSVETIEPLLSVVQDPQPKIREVAIEALGSFRDLRIVPILLKALKDTSAQVRKEAVIALGIRRDLATNFNLVEGIQALLFDLNLEVCRQAAIALGRIGNEEAAKALAQVLQSSLTPPSLKLDIIRALSWNSTELALDYLQQALMLEEDQICQEIIAVLGRLTEPKLKARAAKILINFWYSEKGQTSKPQLRQNLATALGILGEIAAIAPLNHLADDREKNIRLHAIAALKKLEVKDN